VANGYVDPPAAPEESEARVTRKSLAGRGLLAAVGIAVGGVALGRRSEARAATPSAALDEKIFNFALLLEYLQAGFYAEADQSAALDGEIGAFAATVADHERQHVEFLRRRLGAKGRSQPKFAFGDATNDTKKFLRAAVLLENIGVAAYNGQAANLTKPALAAAAEIVSVEGRHAAWISDLAGVPPAPHAADVGRSATEVVAALRSTGFIRSM
jgi:Ferritin-like domain